MKLVVGLGNPGRRYAATRHNVGVRILEHFAARCGIALAEHRFEGRFGRGRLALSGQGSEDLGLLAPEAFMNRSGGAVASALRWLPVGDPAADLLLLYDDVDLPFGRLRVRAGGGAGGHRGVGDVIEALGRNDFPRLRFGVGRPEGGLETADWVLSRFSAAEEERLPERLDAAADAVAAVLCEGVSAAMNRFNRDPAAGSGNP